MEKQGDEESCEVAGAQVENIPQEQRTQERKLSPCFIFQSLLRKAEETSAHFICRLRYII